MSHEFPRPAGDSWLAPAAVTSERRNNETRMGVDGRAAWREAIVRGRGVRRGGGKADDVALSECRKIW